MKRTIKKTTVEKENLHPRNRHRSRYDFKKLVIANPALLPFVFINEYENETIDFANPMAVKALNKALLKQFYEINDWDIPANYLCPPIPGRADYIHYIADLLGDSNNGKIPKGKQINCLDIGVGANAVYPLIANYEYGWAVVGADIDVVAIASAKKIIEKNQLENISVRKQNASNHIFKNIITASEQFDVSVCNPPFHESLAAAQAGTSRKVKNLSGGKKKEAVLNFGGQANELWCKGGELAFVSNMIYESALFATSCYWFTSLVSKSAHLPSIYNELEKVNAVEVKTIEMKQGNKISRVVAWTFLNKAQQKEWQLKRWGKL
jgi:23S rRNA (adenine1618-N6)-methyltransferase